MIEIAYLAAGLIAGAALNQTIRGKKRRLPLALLPVSDPRLSPIERKLDALLAELHIVPPVAGENSTLSPAVRELLAQNKGFRAIQQYREETGVGWTEAKAVLEKREAARWAAVEHKFDLVLEHLGIREDELSVAKTTDRMRGMLENIRAVREEIQVNTGTVSLGGTPAPVSSKRDEDR